MAPKQKKSKPSKAAKSAVPELTDIEKDLLMQMEHGYQLETNSMGSAPLLRKGDEVLRPASVNRSTIKALEERGMITSTTGRDPLTLVWRIK